MLLMNRTSLTTYFIMAMLLLMLASFSVHKATKENKLTQFE